MDEPLGAIKVLRRVVKEQGLAEAVPLPWRTAVLKRGMGHVRLQTQFIVLFLHMGAGISNS